LRFRTGLRGSDVASVSVVCSIGTEKG
jgi:hypothetical protein